MSPRIDAREAWDRVIGDHSSRWDSKIAQVNASPAIVQHRPKFSIDRDDSVFCIGSCFARNIEEHLIYQGIRVSSKRIICPRVELATRPNSVVNKFTTRSMLNELEWIDQRGAVDESWFEQAAAGWMDLQLSPTLNPVSLERAIERREYLSGAYFSRLKAADVVILTLGLNEVWHDARTDRYLNISPGYASLRRNPDRYTVEITDIGANTANLEAIRERLKAYNPQMRMVVTVSPVPMDTTFSGRDVFAANTYSKSVLRCAAEALACGHADVDYFPSYEMITLAPRADTFAADYLHVRNGPVGAVVRYFLKQYAGLEEIETDFIEVGYLSANPDVDEAVRRGEYESGFEHWNRYGRAEGRSLLPEDLASPLMRAAHI